MCMMDATQHILGLLLSFSFTFGNNVTLGVLNIQEGRTAIFECSGNATEYVWYVSWVILKKKPGLRTELTTCNNPNTGTKICNKGNQCWGTSQCFQKTDIQGGRFISQLKISNVTTEFRQSVIECIMGDTLHYSTDDIFIMESYNVNVYYVSNPVECDASRDDNNVIKISCRAAKVYPTMNFRIFPEVVNNISSYNQDGIITNLPELLNITSTNYKLLGRIEYFDAYCFTKYYPTQNGTFRFRVGIFFDENSPNPVINFTTNFVTISSVSGDFKMEREGQIACVFQTGKKEFYLLLASIMTLAVTSFIIISWAIWTKQCTCGSSGTVVEQGNEYESIQYVAHYEGNNCVPVNSSDETYVESSVVSTLFSDFTNEEEIYPQQSYERRGCISNLPAYRPHANCVEAGLCVCYDKTYIEPSTPTLLRSSEKHSAFGSSFSDDNCKLVPVIHNTCIMEETSTQINTNIVYTN